MSKWEPVSVPYKSDTLPLPPLPTTEEILNCPNVLWDRSSKVVAINDEIVVKFGGTKTWEGQALIYLERHVPEVSAPRLYAMYKEWDEEYHCDQVFMIMQRAPGVQLDTIWDSLTESEKDDIVSKLKQNFDIMREVQCPFSSEAGDFFGSLDGGAPPHYLFFSQKGDKILLGPYHGEEAFIKGLVDNFRAFTKRNRRPDYKVRYYEKYLAQVLKGHRPRLTHGDVQRKNIMVNEIPSRKNDKGERSFDVVLVDWVNSGWFPEYWDFFCASAPLIFEYWEEDWCWRVQEFLQVFPAELGIMRMLDKDLGGL
ncbi:uncharacterized protein DSM5745_02206 [Aspergillus mulundensis]|uniref:Aminoglycoside phosphotransferase domain-containing protein n=1 Tax=Aspergillus mulundensis TaxID=1810919 RepID=A0A3D8SW97_9EURO|nr:Uncharacterized protein DSM5745_02206 [Aspergillus mulundensis]RDW90431.1 Uncharacterized protein DSM5745_02206 [Aspergillus mulundensis]